MRAMISTAEGWPGPGAGVASLIQTAILGLILILAAVLVTLIRRWRRVDPVAEVALSQRLSPRPRIAVIVNPTKLDLAPGLRATITTECHTRGFGDPLWLETSLDDPGTGQAQTAIAAGVAAVFVLGGDGTVRTVLARLAGTGIPVALLPAGTGNLLARNLGLPLGDLNAALGVAFSGTERPIDLAIAEIDVTGAHETATVSAFTVMAGLGFDAEVMAAVEPELKRRVGWWAYVAAGIGKLSGGDHRVTISIDHNEPIARRVRSVVIGNCGTLTGGIRLMPEAVIDDGLLDVVIVAPKGLIGWGSVLLAIISGRRRGHPRVEHLQGKSVDIRAVSPMHVQLDGDALGTAMALRAQVEPGVSLIRVGGAVRVPDVQG